MGRPRRPAHTSKPAPAIIFSERAAYGSVRERETLVATLVIAVATVLAYSNTFGASFHFDDFSSIIENETLRDLRRLWPPSGNRWLGYLSFALNYRFAGLEVWGYHFVNLLIHVCNGLLVFWLTAITLRTPALRRAEAGPLVRRYLPLAAGLLFALHPLQTQAVTYVVQRFAALATLFFLLSLTLFALARAALEADRLSKARAAGLYGLSLLAAAASMKTKEISFTLPIVAAAYELLFLRPGRHRLLLLPLAAIALMVPLGLVGRAQTLGDALGDVSRLAAETGEIPRSVYLLTQSRVVVTYLRLLVLPVRQNLDYDFSLSSSLADPAVLASTALLLTIGALAVYLLVRARRTNRAEGALAFFGIAWFFVTLSVESSIVPIRDVIFEHRVYLPCVGAAVAAGTLLLSAVEHLRLRTSLGLQAALTLLVTAGPLGAATYARNVVWKDDLTLWSDVVAKSPLKPRAHNSLGNAYKRVGRVDEAIREYREAVRLPPGYALAHFNLGNAYQAKGRIDDAIGEYREALRANAGHVEAHFNLGGVYHAKAQLDDAMREYREAIRLAPGHVGAHCNIGNIHDARGQLDDAMREYRKAIELDPRSSAAHNNLGADHHVKGQLDDAIREYREAIRLEPRNAEAHSNLGGILMQRGRTDEAVEEYRRALELQPLPEIVLNYARALDAGGRRAEAIAYYQRFLEEAGRRFPEHAEIVKSRIARFRAPQDADR